MEASEPVAEPSAQEEEGAEEVVPSREGDVVDPFLANLLGAAEAALDAAPEENHDNLADSPEEPGEEDLTESEGKFERREGGVERRKMLGSGLTSTWASLPFATNSHGLAHHR